MAEKLVQNCGCQTFTFQPGTLGTVSFCPNMAQSSMQFHTGMCTFGSQMFVLKVCEYIKSGHT
jgi:hypothetical protein